MGHATASSTQTFSSGTHSIANTIILKVSVATVPYYNSSSTAVYISQLTELQTVANSYVRTIINSGHTILYALK